MYHFLKKIPLFAGLSHEDLDQLCRMVTEVRLPAGQELFAEGDLGDQAYVIKEGQIEIWKHSDGHQVLLAVRQPGEVIGEMALVESSSRNATARAQTDSLLVSISAEQLDHLLNVSPSAARSMLHTFAARLRSTDILLQQSEKMAQLGTLAAGMAHELNNPASAALRGSQQLRAEVMQLQQAQRRLGLEQLSPQTQASLDALDELARQQPGRQIDLDPLDRQDREAELEDALTAWGIPEAWRFTPNLIDLSLDAGRIQELARQFPPHLWTVVLEWLDAAANVYALLDEVEQGASRITEIVKAFKIYVYLDQGPVQDVDLHAGLDSTLVLLRNKLKGGVNVRREYAPDLPHIQAYGGELNQVWMNIIDNACDAMDGKGEITIRTRREGEWVVVEIEDNGPGVPPEIQAKIFDPFFTTKPQGKGAGLGLNISYKIVQKHYGEIKLFSRPGKTVFEVWLPLNFTKARAGDLAPPPQHRADEETIRAILTETRTIAVVGITDRLDRPAHSVPAYLQEQGYRIIPINPFFGSVLGEKTYPALQSVPEPVDLVLIFLTNEKIPPVVDAAIAIGARAVWMQEGIIHDEAARVARQAGLKVVMDTCIRVQHKRLLGGETRRS